MPEFTLSENGRHHVVNVQANTPLLWVLRDQLSLTGAKYSCGIGLCGSCTVLVDNEPVRSCTTRIDQVTDGGITTIEGLGATELPSAWQWRILNTHTDRFDEMPEIETHLVEGRAAPGGMGEVPLSPLTPAVANAVFDTVGVRVRRLPISATPSGQVNSVTAAGNF